MFKNEQKPRNGYVSVKKTLLCGIVFIISIPLYFDSIFSIVVWTAKEIINFIFVLYVVYPMLASI